VSLETDRDVDVKDISARSGSEARFGAGDSREHVSETEGNISGPYDGGRSPTARSREETAPTIEEASRNPQGREECYSGEVSVYEEKTRSGLAVFRARRTSPQGAGETLLSRFRQISRGDEATRLKKRDFVSYLHPPLTNSAGRKRFPPNSTPNVDRACEQMPRASPDQQGQKRSLETTNVLPVRARPLSLRASRAPLRRPRACKRTPPRRCFPWLLLPPTHLDLPSGTNLGRPFSAVGRAARRGSLHRAQPHRRCHIATVRLKFSPSARRRDLRAQKDTRRRRRKRKRSLLLQRRASAIARSLTASLSGAKSFCSPTSEVPPNASESARLRHLLKRRGLFR